MGEDVVGCCCMGEGVVAAWVRAWLGVNAWVRAWLLYGCCYSTILNYILCDDVMILKKYMMMSQKLLNNRI